MAASKERKKRYFGVMPLANRMSGYIGLQSEFKTPEAFWSQFEGDREFDDLTIVDVIPVWLAWRCFRNDYGDLMAGFVLVGNSANGKTPGWVIDVQPDRSQRRVYVPEGQLCFPEMLYVS